MAEAQVTLKLSPREFDLVVESLQQAWDADQDMMDDPVVKQEDKQIPAQEMMELESILRQLGYKVDRRR